MVMYMPHIRQKKLKSGTAHEVIYYIRGKQYTKYFSALIPPNIVKAWAAEKEKQLAFQKAGIEEYYEATKHTDISLTEYFEYYKTSQRSSN